jgi:aldehyde dehydrogenase (NAD+)
LFVHESVKDTFVKKYKYYIEEFYQDALENNQFGSIITEKHFERLVNLYKEENILMGGSSNEKTRKIEPTVVEVKDMTVPIMQEEIFGPILPVISYKDIDEVINYVKLNPSPLALYLFTRDKNIEKRVLTECQFGGGCVNDTIVHIASDHLPFGGVGNSGMGTYHGSSSFSTFSHYKSVLKKHPSIDLPIRYAPFGGGKDNIIRRFLR